MTVIIPRRSFHDDGKLPEENEIWVYGSNHKGAHGAGAALIAVQQFGAVHGRPRGLVGRSYGIVTRNYHGPKNLTNRTLAEIEQDVRAFVDFTNMQPMVKYWVTSVGCGRAGYEPKDIAPMFRLARNCSFPHNWADWLDKADLKALDEQ